MIDLIRRDFPILEQTVNGKPLVYLDNAASTQHPNQVIDAVSNYYRRDHANVHRGVHALSQRATDRFDEVRRKIASFMGASSEREIIFTKGSTEGINLVAYSYGRTYLKPGDRILLTHMEHHANIIPWQVVAQATGAEIHVIPIDDRGQLLLDEFEKMLDERVKVVGVCHVSNSLGTINPIEWITAKAHEVGAVVMVDGAQACAHVPLRLAEWGVDFYTLASHKMYGPTGVGALYGKLAHLEAMPPYQTGGGMIRSVTFEKTTYAPPPEKFEPGTPNIADVIGLGAAIDWLLDSPSPLEGRAVSLGPNEAKLGVGSDGPVHEAAPPDTRLQWAAQHEHHLTEIASQELAEIPGVTLVGTAENKSSTVSFTMANAHPHDIGTILDLEGVAIRAGHHCCQPLMARFGIAATARASFAIYNTEEEVDSLVRAVGKVKELFG